MASNDERLVEDEVKVLCAYYIQAGGSFKRQDKMTLNSIRVACSSLFTLFVKWIVGGNFKVS